MLVFTLASVFVFYLFLYSLQLSSYSHGCYLARLALSFVFLSFLFPPSFFLISHPLLFSFLVSVFHSPHPSLSLFISLLYSLTHSVSLSLSSPAAPPSPSSFPLTLSLSLFIFLSSLPSLTQSLSLSLIPQFPSFLSLPSFTCFLNHPFSLTHSLTLFFCLFLPPSV